MEIAIGNRCRARQLLASSGGISNEARKSAVIDVQLVNRIRRPAGAGIGALVMRDDFVRSRRRAGVDPRLCRERAGLRIQRGAIRYPDVSIRSIEAESPADL